MSNIVVYKLVTSEWVVGKKLETLGPGPYVMIEQPLIIHIVPKDANSYALALVPFDPTNPTGTIRLYTDAIVAESTEVAAGLQKAYTQQTSSIEIVTSLPGLK